MKRIYITIAILIIAVSAFSQPSVSWFILDDPGTAPEITIPEHPPTEGVIFEDPGDTSEVGMGESSSAPVRDRAAVRAALTERSRMAISENHPPIVIIDLSIPRTTGSIPTETIEDGIILRSERIYLKPVVEFVDINPGTAILMLAPVREAASVSASSTVQEAKAAIDEEFRALSFTTPDDEIYIDITEFVDEMRAGRIGSRFVLAPLSPRERFTIPESRGGELFEVVQAIE